MNNLYTINKTIILQLFLGMAFFSHSLYGITINNKPLDKFIKPSQTFVFTPQTKNEVTCIDIQNNNLRLGADNVTKLPNLKELFETLKNRKSGILTSETCNISSNIIGNNFGSYLVARKTMNLQAKILLHFKNSILESPNITITSNEMKFDDCFLINPQTLNVISNTPESKYQNIHITFNENINPAFITGEINLKNNQTSKISLTNVKEVAIQFSPKAWED